jgi:hypothetical protein
MVARVLALLSLLIGVAQSFGAISETITSFAVTNYTGYVIASDAANAAAGYERDAIRTSVTIQYTTDNANTSATKNYQIVFRLLDPSNNPVQILDENGAVGTSYTVSASVTLPFFIFGSAVTSISGSYSGPLAPVDRLDPLKQYTAEVRLYSGSFRGIPIATGDVATDGPRTYYHFTNTSSADFAYNVIAIMNGAAYNHSYMVQTDPAKDAFSFNALVSLRRYDGFNSPPANSTITLGFDIELRDAATDAVIPLASNHIEITRSVPTYVAGSPNAPAFQSFIQTIEFAPAPGVQLDAVNNTYKLHIALTHIENPLVIIGNPPSFAADNDIQLGAVRMMQFNGTLLFGGIQTKFTSIANDPVPGALSAPNYLLTTLAVDASSGFVVGAPDHTYGDGTALNVRLRPNGNAELDSGSVVLTAPSPDVDSMANVTFTRGPITLDTAGAHGNIIVNLPTGFGYRLDMNSRLIIGQYPFAAVVLNQALEPTTDLTRTATIYGAEETKPLWLEISRLTWKVATGEFLMDSTSRAFYVRGTELDQLEAATVLDPAMKIKRSNEQYFRSIEKVSSPQISLKPDANGCALLTMNVSFLTGGQRAHFPYNARMVWDSGQMTIKDDLVVPGSSAMASSGSVQLSYNRDCNDVTCPGAVGPASMTFKPDGAQFTFTEDGGMTRPGTLTTPAPLDWGWIASHSRYAHATDNWTPANFHMPGLFIRGDRTVKGVQFRPAVILFTGVLPANPSGTERPGTPAYQAGLGDYAGLNFRVGIDGAHTAESTLGGKAEGPYSLTARSKYYIRQAGVSGIHEAVPGSFPSTATLYGYQVNFSNFGLAFLDSQNVDSRTEGMIHVKSPSNIDQNFKRLIFSCLGALEHADVPSGEATLQKVLEYWAADFITLAINFKSDAACDPGEAYLVLGVEAWASHVSDPLYGELGFQSNGNLITEADALVSGVTSRLKLPNTFKLKGPSNEKYTVTPVGEAYYNNYDYFHAGPGWINIAGKMDVPFFEDLKFHMHTSAQRSNTTAVIHLMGGWPGKGFEVAGKNYFNQTPFDTDNKGYPDDVSPEDYHKGKSDDSYLVRAQRNWLGVVDFDYPLDWSTSTRSFKSHKPVENKLLVVKAEHQVKYLDAENAELTFGIEYQGMPKIDIANLAFNAIDEGTGVIKAFEQAEQDELRKHIDEGLQQLNTMLSDQMHKLFDTSFDTLIKPKLVAMYGDLQSSFNATSHTWTIAPGTTIQNWLIDGGSIPNNVEKQLNSIIGTLGSGLGVINDIDGGLAKVDQAITDIESLLAKTDGHRTVATKLIKKLVGQLAADFAGAFVDDKLNEFMSKLDPTIDQIVDALDDLKNIVHTLRTQLTGANQFVKELQDKMTALAGDIHNVAVQASSDINAILNGIDISVDNPFVHYTQDELIALIRQKLEDRFFASKVPTAIQVILKERIYDLDASLRESIDSVFAQINDVMKGIISETLAGLDNSINGMLGKVNDVLGAGKITGYAHINNDALKLLRLDIYAQLKVPSEMELNAYIQIKELDSEGYPESCLPPGGKATEVSVGATDVEVNWISPNLRANIGFKATFDPGTSPPTLMGVGGSFEMTGEVNFEAFKVKQFAASMAFGEKENYFSAAARVLINKYEGFGGIYFGKTCTLEPIALWDPDVASVLGTPPFTGAYVYGEVWIPISEALLGIPATCFFNITAGVGAGAFYFVEGPTYGGKMLLGAHGELLCIVSVGGQIKLVGVKNPDGLTLKGNGEVEGSIGPCPFCISFSKSIDMTYKNGSWDVDF